MQNEWHVMLGSASAFWTEATFHSRMQMQMQIQEQVGLLVGNSARVNTPYAPTAREVRPFHGVLYHERFHINGKRKRVEEKGAITSTCRVGVESRKQRPGGVV